MRSRDLLVTAGHLHNEYKAARQEKYFQESYVEAIVEHRRKLSELSRVWSPGRSTIKNILVWKPQQSDVTTRDDVTSDIVMLKLKTPLTLNDYVQKICLPPPEFKADREVVLSDQKKSSVCLITGWGKSSYATLKQATVPVSYHPISCNRK